MSKFLDFLGTTANRLQIAIGGVILKNNSGTLQVRNATDTAHASIEASQMSVTGDFMTLNSDAADTGTDRSVIIGVSATASQSWTLTLPPDDGSPSQVLSTDGSGVTSWVTVSGTADKISCDTTALAFGTASPLSLFTLPANAVVLAARVTIDTPFNGTSPSLSIGIAGTTSKYLASTQVDLKAAAATVFEVYPGLAPVGTTEALIATYVASSSSAGAARIEIDYVVPA